MLKKPRQREATSSKAKKKATNPSPRQLQGAAEKASFARSPYHCPDPRTGRRAFRPKPATPCPDGWTEREGANAVKAAIVAGRVSEGWINGFPRHIWHHKDGIWYEGRTAKGTAGEYHGYPIESSELPFGITR